MAKIDYPTNIPVDVRERRFFIGIDIPILNYSVGGTLYLS